MKRVQRLVFGEVAELYDRARPSYPAALLDHLSSLIGPGGGPVLDVGCGTGKATVLLAARGLRGVGLEPDPNMAAVARRNLEPFPGWAVAAGEFETYPGLADGERFSMVTCAQAWHWLDPEVRMVQAARLLRPGGWIALFWNRRAEDPDQINLELDEVYAELFPEQTPGHGGLPAGSPPESALLPAPDFDEPSRQGFPWIARYTTAEWLELLRTHSNHRMLTHRQLKKVLAQVAAIIDRHGGSFEYHYECWLWTARRR